MLDRVITAQEAVQSGFANGIIEGLGTDHWPDLEKIPAIGKLLATDSRTLWNCKELINAARDTTRMEQTITREAKALCETWLDPEFPPKMASYIQSISAKTPKL